MKKYLLLFLMCVYASIGAWAGEVSYPFTFGDGNLSKVEKVDFGNNQYGLVVTIGKTGDFAIFANMLGNSGDSYISSNYLNYGRLRIVCTNGAVINATDVATYESKMSNAPLTCLDLTDAAFDADATITSFIANGVAYVALPQGKDISDVTLKDDGTIKGVVTSNGSSAIYTAYNGAADANFNTLFIGSSLQNIGTWTITNGVASGSHITAGAETGNILTAIVSNSTATTLNITLDGITNSPTTLAPSSSITNLTISGIQYPNQYESLTINGGSALTTLTLEDTTIPGSLTIGGCPELVTADLRGVRKKPNGGSTKLDVTVNDDPKLSNLILYKSSTETGCNVSGTTRPVGSGLTVTYALPAIPIEYDDCKVTINLSARNGATMSDLISDAETELAKSNTNICTLIVTGELTTTDLQSLDDANTATRIDLSETTLATGAAITSLQVPSNLKSLVLPPNQTVKGTTLANTLSAVSSLMYAYSPTSDAGATVPDYVWVNQGDGLNAAYKAETPLLTSIYIKVAANDNTLTATDMDMRNANILGESGGLSNLAFLDLSEAGLTPEISATYKCPDKNDYTGYRIILPNNRTGDQMAIYAANPKVGSIAAVYSYTDTKLNILEINDGSYSPAALADGRIMRSNTTQVNIVSGYNSGQTYANFGPNLLAALNNMGKTNFSVTTKNAQNKDVTTNYTNTVGQSVKTISIETTSAAPNTLTFDNPSINTLKIDRLAQEYAELNVSVCSALTSLSVKGSNLKSVNASGNTSITSADFSGAAIATTTNFNGATSLATFNTTGESIFNGNVDLTSSALNAFTSEARFGGNINFNASCSLASIDLSGATFSNNASVIHVDAETAEGEGNTIISGLKKTDGIKVPSSFANNVATRVHPYDASFVNVASTVAPAYNIITTDMTFHEKEVGDNTDHYRYWYQGTADSQKILTLGTSDSRRLSDAIAGIPAEQNYSTTQYAKIKVVGPLTSADITKLKELNCTALDLSEATSGETGENAKTIGELLKTSFSNTSTLGVHSNVKFIALPDSCTRDYILNEKALAGLKNSVYCVIAVNETSEGKDLTSYSFQSGSLQPAVVAFQNSAANSWTKILSSETTPTTKYTSTVSNFKKLKISGLINSYDLSKGNQKLDADGHLSWAEDVVESTDQTRTLNGAYNVYGPFSACDLLTEIDLRDAYFEPKSGQSVEEGSVYYRYWYSDMTLSFLNVITTATYKVVIPQNSKVREIPADFMRCSTGIRAICIPSNIQAIRTRAFYTIDYVWTTADAYATTTSTADPEGNNTRLDNGAKLSDGKQVYAMKYDTGKHKYEENPAFLDSYYTADYSGDKGGGTYTFGSTLKLIETGAFANTQPNVSDVYVLNKIAPECHVDAFNTVMYTGNGGYNPTAVSKEGIITRGAYFNGRWITKLHYPRQTTDPNIQRYTDPTRSYSIATGERDGKGAPLYYPNQSEFIRAYQQGTYGYTWNAWGPTRQYGSVNNEPLTNTTAGWTAANQAVANQLYKNYKDTLDAKIANNIVLTSTEAAHKYYSFYDVSLGGNMKPTDLVDYYNVNWNNGYTTVTPQANLYPQSEIDANNDADTSGEKTTKDYRGWHQFVLTAYAANTVLEEEPYRSYITDNEWWTICPTFDITREEAIILFGNRSQSTVPFVSKLRYVIRDYGRKTIFLNFTENLCNKKENRVESTDKHGKNDSFGIVEILNSAPNAGEVVMSAGVPYLIKPTFPAGSSRQYRIYKNQNDIPNTTETNIIQIAHEGLYNKIKAAQEESGTTQRNHIKNGIYTVPVFVSEAGGEGLTKETVEMDGDKPKIYTIGDINYQKSTVWSYSFVGTFYKSFLPHYCFFLGWDSSLNNGNGGAKFYYHNGNFDTLDREMSWNNETGVICPLPTSQLSEGKFPWEVTEAKDMETPAQWVLLNKLSDEAFKTTNGNNARRYEVMEFNAPDVIAVDDSETTGIENVNGDINESLNGSNTNVYTINGQYVGTSLNGLAKGVYIVNGKKFIVK